MGGAGHMCHSWLGICATGHACQGVKDEICLAVVLCHMIESASQGEDDDTDEENGDDNDDNDDKVCINDDADKMMPMETMLVQMMMMTSRNISIRATKKS